MSIRTRIKPWLQPKAVIYGIAVLINLCHPFFHMFEGGSFDATLIYLDAWLIQIDPFIPTVAWRHTHD